MSKVKHQVFRLYFDGNPVKMSKLIRNCSRIVKNNNKYSLYNIHRQFHEDFSAPPLPIDKEKRKENLTPGAVASKYDIFRDDESPIILDVDEERSRYNSEIETVLPVRDQYEGINLERKSHE